MLFIPGLLPPKKQEPNTVLDAAGTQGPGPEAKHLFYHQMNPLKGSAKATHSLQHFYHLSQRAISQLLGISCGPFLLTVSPAGGSRIAIAGTEMQTHVYYVKAASRNGGTAGALIKTMSNCN